MASPISFNINVPEQKIERLRQKLALTDLPDELDDADWDYGSPLEEVRRLSAHWQHDYNWRTFEAKLNELSNFTIDISVEGFGSLNLHLVHERSQSASAIPLLFVHGWPGSYIEVLKLLPLLKESVAGSPTFHIVAPSLPNFAWSEGIRKRGFGLAQYAEVCHKIMQRLGYSQYVTQGGDWGFYITRAISLLYPSHCLATHVNMVRCSPPAFLSQPLAALQHLITPYSEDEKAGLKRSSWFANEGSGYRVIQTTKPQTPGYAMSDSPVALLAWILEKLHDWTDSYPWTDDEILDWVSIYYFSRAGAAASLRIYYEAAHSQPSYTPQGNVCTEGGYISRDRLQRYIGQGVKLGLAYFPKELTVTPMKWGQTLGQLVHVKKHEKGGHFGAYECPDAIAHDLRTMFGQGGPCQGLLK